MLGVRQIYFTMHDGEYTGEGQLPSDMDSVMREIEYKYSLEIGQFKKFFSISPENFPHFSEFESRSKMDLNRERAKKQNQKIAYLENKDVLLTEFRSLLAGHDLHDWEDHLNFRALNIAAERYNLSNYC